VAKFRLQRVLELRERKERDAATAFAAAQEQADLARAEQERLLAARDALAASAVQSAPEDAASVGALRTFHFLLGRLDERVAHASAASTSAEQTVEQRQDELRAAFRDRRALDRLRERHEENRRAAESAADRRQMDEIALTRFNQTGPGSSDADTTTSHDHEQ